MQKLIFTLLTMFIFSLSATASAAERREKDLVNAKVTLINGETMTYLTRSSIARTQKSITFYNVETREEETEIKCDDIASLYLWRSEFEDKGGLLLRVKEGRKNKFCLVSAIGEHAISLRYADMYYTVNDEGTITMTSQSVIEGGVLMEGAKEAVFVGAVATNSILIGDKHGFRRKASELFAKDPDLVAKIQDKTLTAKDLDFICESYSPKE